MKALQIKEDYVNIEWCKVRISNLEMYLDILKENSLKISISGQYKTIHYQKISFSKDENVPKKNSNYSNEISYNICNDMKKDLLTMWVNELRRERINYRELKRNFLDKYGFEYNTIK